MTVPPSITDLTSSPVPARASAIYTCQLVDQNGIGIPAGSLTALTLTIYDPNTAAIVNGVNGVNILNADRGAVDAQGNLTLTLKPGDTAVVGPPIPPGRQQYRQLVLDFTYNGGNSTGRHQINIAIVALAEA